MINNTLYGHQNVCFSKIYFVFHRISLSNCIIFLFLRNTRLFDMNFISHFFVNSFGIISLLASIICLLISFPKGIKLRSILLLISAFGLFFFIKFDSVILFSLFVIYVSRTISFDYILKVIKRTIIGVLVFVLLLTMFGVLKDDVFLREELIITTKKYYAHSLGFLYYSAPAYALMCLTIIYVYENRRKLTLAIISITLLISYINYIVFVTRIAFIVPILFMVGYLILNKYRKFCFSGKQWKWIAILLYPTLMLLNYFVFSNVAYSYIFENDFLNLLFKSRFLLNAKAFEIYELNLWGNKIENVLNDETEYFFIDSGYVSSLIQYGFVFSMLVMIYYSYLFYNIYKSKNGYLYLWMLIFSVVNIINGFLISIVYNPIILLSHALLSHKLNKK